MLEAWSTAAALAATTERLEIMAAVRPGFRNPAVVAKMAANIDRISRGPVHAQCRLRVVGGGGAAVRDGVRRARRAICPHGEFLAVLKGMWTQERTTVDGKYAHVAEAYLAPKPVQQPWPRLYAGGESPAAKELISRECDAYLMHGDDLETVRGKIAEMRDHAAARGKTMTYGMAAYVICRDTEEEAQAELARITDVKETAGYAGFKDFTTMSQLERELTLARLLGLEPRPAAQPRRHAGADRRADAGIRGCGARSLPHPMQPDAGGDGADRHAGTAAAP